MTTDGPGRIGERVAELRRMAGMSAKELAVNAATGLTPAVIANIESGRKTDVTVRQLVALAAALGCSPIDLAVDLREPFSRYDMLEENDVMVTAGSFRFAQWWAGEVSGEFMDWRANNVPVNFPRPLDGRIANRFIMRLLDQRESARTRLADIGRLTFVDPDSARAKMESQAALYEIELRLKALGVDVDRFVPASLGPDDHG